MADVSKLAIVEKGAKIASGVRVGPFSYVGPHVRIGPGCVIENNVSITGRTVLAANNHVFPMSVIGAGEDEGGGEGRCLIGEANDIREQVTIYGGRDEPTRIGTDNLVMIGCLIGAGACVANHEIFANCTHVETGAVIEDYVRTSAFVVIHSGVRVGAYSFVAGYASIDRDAPPFAMLQGTPFRVRGVNTNNLNRCGFGQEDIAALKRAFRELYDSTGRDWDPDALARLLSGGEVNPHVRRLGEALRASADREAGDG